MIVVPKRRGRLFFFDETDVYWCPEKVKAKPTLLGRIYQLPSSQVKINSPGKNKVRYLLGSVEYPTGEKSEGKAYTFGFTKYIHANGTRK